MEKLTVMQVSDILHAEGIPDSLLTVFAGKSIVLSLNAISVYI